MRTESYLARRGLISCLGTAPLLRLAPLVDLNDIGNVPRPPNRAIPGSAAVPLHTNLSAPIWQTLPATPALPQPTASGLAPVNGVKVYYAQFGRGPDILMLHGGLANSQYWGLQVSHLAQDFTVTVLDTRGHGRSPLISNVFNYDAFAADSFALMDFLKIEKASVVGWSDGAVTGLKMAMLDSSKVIRLFAFGANISNAGIIQAGASSKTFQAFSARCKSEYAKLSPTPEKWRQLLDGLRPIWRSGPNITIKQLSEIKVPTTISDGVHDEIIRTDHVEMMARAIPGSRLLLQADVSHFAMLQNAQQFDSALVDFLSDKKQ